MSRIGNMPIAILEKVTVDIKGQTVTIKGPLGTNKVELHPLVLAKFADKTLTVEKKTDNRQAKALHGLFRALLANAVEGVTTGFKKELDLVGVGYRAELKGNDIHLSLGYSHPVIYPVPAGVKASVKLTRIELTGIDKALIGETAATLIRLRKPDAYKGKGIRHAGTQMKLKPGKAAGAGAKKAA